MARVPGTPRRENMVSALRHFTWQASRGDFWNFSMKKEDVRSEYCGSTMWYQAYTVKINDTCIYCLLSGNVKE